MSTKEFLVEILDLMLLRLDFLLELRREGTIETQCMGDIEGLEGVWHRTSRDQSELLLASEWGMSTELFLSPNMEKKWEVLSTLVRVRRFVLSLVCTLRRESLFGSLIGFEEFSSTYVAISFFFT